MATAGKSSAVVTFRVPPALGRSLEREARRRGCSRSAVVRAIVEEALGGKAAPRRAGPALRRG